MIRVTVWNEGLHEKLSNEVAGVYPAGIHGCIKNFLSTQEDIKVRTATLTQRKCGLSDEVLEETDVLIWWGHMAHDKVPDKIVEKVHKRVLAGMGLVVLHSGHHSKIFRALMGTTCNLRWRDADRERLWCINPAHPFARVAAGREATVKFSISSPATKQTPHSTTNTFSASSSMLSVGQTPLSPCVNPFPAPTKKFRPKKDSKKKAWLNNEYIQS